MPNVREIWNFKPQNQLHWRMLNSSIAIFFAILLQCNSIAFLPLDPGTGFLIAQTLGPRLGWNC